MIAPEGIKGSALTAAQRGQLLDLIGEWVTIVGDEASAAKLWHTDLQWEVCDAALQLHGGAGYMNEYLIARLWRDARVTRIFGGTNEIMKEVIARAI